MKGGRLWAATGLVSLLFLSVVSSDPALAADLKEAVDQLAVQLAKSVPEGRTLRVAVTDFPDLQGVISDLGRYIAERLTTRLSVQIEKFRVIERRRLGQALGELRFSVSDLVDPDKAKQFGKMLGAEAIVVGTVSDLGNVVDADARIIEIETSNVLPGTTAAISKDETVRQMIERNREMPTPPSVGAVSPVSAPTVALGTVKYQEYPEFRVEVAGLRVLTGSRIELVVNYVNKTQKVLLLGLPDWCIRTTTMSDDAGNDYPCDSTTGIGKVFTGPYHNYERALTLPAGGSATASFRFNPPSEMAKKGSRFLFNSGHVLGALIGESRKVKVEARYSISILNIEPR